VARLAATGSAAGTDVVEASFVASDAVIRRSNRVSVSWTSPPPPPPPVPTAVPIPAPKDSDHDGLPDVCDILPPGDAPVVAGTTAAEPGASGSAARPIKGVVRTLSATAKGNFRTIGGASTTSATDGTWIVSDRCNGTLTEVGRGKVAVHDTKLKKDFMLRSGQGYLARARLFAARRPAAGRP
jgi:hypothetical protein